MRSAIVRVRFSRSPEPVFNAYLRKVRCGRLTDP